jgi:hypothetical protein
MAVLQSRWFKNKQFNSFGQLNPQAAMKDEFFLSSALSVSIRLHGLMKILQNSLLRFERIEGKD